MAAVTHAPSVSLRKDRLCSLSHPCVGKCGLSTIKEEKEKHHFLARKQLVDLFDSSFNYSINYRLCVLRFADPKGRLTSA